MSKVKIYLILLGVMLAWGLNIVALKLLVSYFSPLTMTAVRIFIAGFTIISILFLLKKLQKPQGTEYYAIMASSILGVVLHHGLLAFGLANTTAVKGSIILGFSPLLTAILAIIFGFTQMGWQRFLGFVVGAFGVTMAVMRGGEGITGIAFGDILVFLSILSQAFSFLIISKVSKTLNPVVLTGYMMLSGSLVLLLLASIIEPAQFMTFTTAPLSIIAVLLVSAIVATAIGHVTYNYAISKIGAAETAIFGNFNTLFSLMATAILLKESVGINQIIGCLLIIFGVLTGTGTLEAFIRRKAQLNR
ncbi:DMT family transporter [Lysinibacillus piscis]|uniref:Membrane protein n=1 Tax=Lysinibacillus piscis TaxID=2518931 RepID=A0ABQ5NFY1_9BACI|nr:DMT family transporter [Lysinibacillus sp. KH24]GLC87185.1 membrane protein [Lysinibacillus sp. KH24]